jgi:hypothetical protein
LAACSGVAHAQSRTATLYASSVRANTAWSNPADSVGNPGCEVCECTIGAGRFALNANGTDRTWLEAEVGNIDLAEIPSNWRVTSIRVDMLMSFDFGTTSNVDWGYRFAGQTTSWSGGISPTFSSGAGCQYRLNRVEVLGPGVTRSVAEVNTMELRVRRGTLGVGDGGLRVKAWRVQIVAVPPTPVTPSNDACADAVPATLGTTAVVIPGTTRIDIPTACASERGLRDVWFSFTPPATEPYFISTCSADLDTVVSVQTACGGAQIGCSDNVAGCGPAGLGSRIATPVLTAGTTYRVRVASPDAGLTTLSIEVGCPVCAADFDRDGGVTSADVGAFFRQLELGAPCGDVDQDGAITPADVSEFFLEFERGGC